MHRGKVFKAVTSFPPGNLPIEKQVIEKMLNFSNYQTLGAARNIVQEVHEIWAWSLSCNVVYTEWVVISPYPHHW